MKEVQGHRRVLSEALFGLLRYSRRPRHKRHGSRLSTAAHAAFGEFDAMMTQQPLTGQSKGVFCTEIDNDFL